MCYFLFSTICTHIKYSFIEVFFQLCNILFIDIFFQICIRICYILTVCMDWNIFTQMKIRDTDETADPQTRQVDCFLARDRAQDSQ